MNILEMQEILREHNRRSKRKDVILFDSIRFYIFDTIAEETILFDSLDDLILWIRGE